MPRIYKLKVVPFELFDPCKSVLSVLSVVRFGFFRQSVLGRRRIIVYRSMWKFTNTVVSTSTGCPLSV